MAPRIRQKRINSILYYPPLQYIRMFSSSITPSSRPWTWKYPRREMFTSNEKAEGYVSCHDSYQLWRGLKVILMRAGKKFLYLFLGKKRVWSETFSSRRGWGDISFPDIIIFMSGLWFIYWNFFESRLTYNHVVDNISINLLCELFI